MKPSLLVDCNYGFEDMLRLARHAWQLLGNRHEKVVGWRSKTNVDDRTEYSFNASVGQVERESAVVITFYRSSRFRARVDNGKVVNDYYGCMQEFLEGQKEFNFREKMAIAVDAQMQACARLHSETEDLEAEFGRSRPGFLMRMLGFERPSTSLKATRRLNARSLSVLHLAFNHLYGPTEHYYPHVQLDDVAEAIRALLVEDFRHAHRREAALWNFEYMIDIIEQEKIEQEGLMRKAA